MFREKHGQLLFNFFDLLFSLGDLLSKFRGEVVHGVGVGVGVVFRDSLWSQCLSGSIGFHSIQDTIFLDSCKIFYHVDDLFFMEGRRNMLDTITERECNIWDR